MTDYGRLFADRARFLPAVQDAYHRAPGVAATATRPMPGSLKLRDLDFLDADSSLFTIDAALISAGHYAKAVLPPGMMRRRSGALIMGDSGGFQASTGILKWRGDESRALALDFAERYTDVAPILDIPTRVISPEHEHFNSFAACLAESVKSADYALRRRTGKARLLGVLQGRDAAEADRWDAEMIKRPLDGWAIGGSLRLDMYETARRIVRLVERGLVSDERNHIHIFGTARLDIAVMLSALQRALREHLDTDRIIVTFDCSSASMTLKSHECMAPATVTRTKFAYREVPLPRRADDIGWPSPFPFQNSAIGTAMKVSDLCVDPKPGKSAWDGLSCLLITNHNVETMLQALNCANSILELRPRVAERLAPLSIVRACNALRTMFRDAEPLGRLKLAEADLRAPSRSSNSKDDEERS